MRRAIATLAKRGGNAFGDNSPLPHDWAGDPLPIKNCGAYRKTFLSERCLEMNLL
ncbi:hypothetical protein NGR_b14870 (plasmid) [Sinorhizobium fredii NGR234]|uniref:Uncharacterized protein n=1 Tax=Sinorhizobium fredii (strain NBRC 101917 / NGR234) TaxID=394 RepID=C3KKK2_SINFN|nr:hypothetical protein NGR_b14870 [Sinorhizobium fredii NGR234]